MRVAFIGQGMEICELSKRLADDGHDTACIATYDRERHDADRPEHQCESDHGLYRSVFDYAADAEIDLLETTDFNAPDAIDWIAAREPELLISWRPRTILSDQFVSQLDARIVNMHIGKLPEYRGTATLSWMILNGETETALSIHYIQDRGIDTGDLIEQHAFDIPPGAYPIDIYRIASGIILERCPRVVAMFTNGPVPSIKQNGQLSTYFPRLHTPTDGRLRFDIPPSEFERFVRAFGWPYAGPHCSYGDETLRVARCRVLEEPGRYHSFTNGLIVQRDPVTGSARVIVGGGLVEIQTLRDGNDEIPAADLLKISRRLT